MLKYKRLVRIWKSGLCSDVITSWFFLQLWQRVERGGWKVVKINIIEGALSGCINETGIGCIVYVKCFDLCIFKNEMPTKAFCDWQSHLLGIWLDGNHVYLEMNPSRFRSSSTTKHEFTDVEWRQRVTLCVHWLGATCEWREEPGMCYLQGKCVWCRRDRK